MGARKVCQAPGTVVIYGCKQPHGRWESDLGSLQEQELGTTEQALSYFYKSRKLCTDSKNTNSWDTFECELRRARSTCWWVCGTKAHKECARCVLRAKATVKSGDSASASSGETLGFTVQLTVGLLLVVYTSQSPHPGTRPTV